MATLSSAGIGSGLDVNSLVSQLIAVENQPKALLTRQAATMNVQLSAFGTLQGLTSSLQSAASTLAATSSWATTTANSSDSSAVSASTASGAASGSYSVTVAQLAQAHSLASSGFTTSASAVGSGDLHIQIGGWAAGVFTPKAGSSTVDITISAADNTLDAIKTKINAANAGVTASVVTDTSGARLVLRASASGEESAIRITTTDTDGTDTDSSGLSALAYDPSGGAATSMSQTQAAQNANATINGLAVSSANNTFSNVIDGVTITAAKVTTTPVGLTVAAATGTFKANIGAFVMAFNALAGNLAAQMKYDDATKTAGTLQGDSTALTLQRQLRTLAQQAAGGSSSFKHLSDMGITLQRDGTLKVDDAKLGTALANPDQVALAFSSPAGAAPALQGIAKNFETLAKAITGSDGSITTRSASLQSRLKKNDDEQTRFDTRVAATRARLLAQYTALDTKMASLTALSNYMTQQITNWNKSSG